MSSTVSGKVGNFFSNAIWQGRRIILSSAVSYLQGRHILSNVVSGKVGKFHLDLSLERQVTIYLQIMCDFKSNHLCL